MTKTTYTQSELEAGTKFLNNKNVHFEYDATENTIAFDIAVNCAIWTDGTSIWSRGTVKGVHVHNLYLMAEIVERTDDDVYWSGGLTGNASYDGSGKNGTWFDGVDDASALINRNTSKHSDGLIYTDSGFTENLLKYMQHECDFDCSFTKLNKYLDFDYSEQGMQDYECVNFDVEMDGAFWIACYEQMQKQKKAA